MRFGDAHHIHATHAGGLQRVGQRLAGGLLGLDLLAGLDTVGIVLDTLKTGICRRILALLEMMLDIQRLDRRMQFGVQRAGRTMLRPRVHEIRLRRPVRARLDMPVLRGCDIRVLAAMRVHIIGNPLGGRVAACDTQFAAFTERRLHIHHNQCLGHRHSPYCLGFVLNIVSNSTCDCSHHSHARPCGKRSGLHCKQQSNTRTRGGRPRPCWTI